MIGRRDNNRRAATVPGESSRVTIAVVREPVENCESTRDLELIERLYCLFGLRFYGVCGLPRPRRAMGPHHRPARPALMEKILAGTLPLRAHANVLRYFFFTARPVGAGRCGVACVKLMASGGKLRPSWNTRPIDLIYNWVKSSLWGSERALFQPKAGSFNCPEGQKLHLYEGRFVNCDLWLPFI